MISFDKRIEIESFEMPADIDEARHSPIGGQVLNLLYETTQSRNPKFDNNVADALAELADSELLVASPHKYRDYVLGFVATRATESDSALSMVEVVPFLRSNLDTKLAGSALNALLRTAEGNATENDAGIVAIPTPKHSHNKNLLSSRGYKPVGGWWHKHMELDLIHS